MSDQDQSFEERLRMFFAAVPDLVFRIRKDGTFLDFSPSTEFTTYVPPDRFLDKKIHDIMPTDMADTITAGMDRALSRNRSAGTVTTIWCQACIARTRRSDYSPHSRFGRGDSNG